MSKAADWTWLQGNVSVVNTDMQRVGITTVFWLVHGAVINAGVVGGGTYDDNKQSAASSLQNLARTAAASFSACPQSLYDLWAEFMFGIGWRILAFQLTHLDRWKSMHTYVRRNVIWRRMVRRMVSKGFTSDTAIDHIYSVFGAGTLLKESSNYHDDENRGSWIQILWSGNGSCLIAAPFVSCRSTSTPVLVTYNWCHCTDIRYSYITLHQAS